jgi:hypothetical protein
MKFRSTRSPQVLCLVALGFLGFAPCLRAQQQDHVVSTEDLRRDVAQSAAARKADEAAVRGLLSADRAQQALKSAHLDLHRVDKAVAQLSDEELARLAAKAEKAQADFAAGNLSDRDLLIIIIAIAALVLIIVAVR